MAQSLNQEVLDAEFDDVIKTFAREASIPGVSIVIHQHASLSKPGQNMYKSYGTAYGDTSVTQTTRFPLASLGKHIISLALLRLLGDTNLSAHTPVRSVLPDFRLSNEASGDSVVTFKHLLGHTTGLESNTGCWSEITDSSTPIYAYLAHLPCARLPGISFSYNTIMYDVCALAIQALSGEDVELYLERVFFGPLSMTRTGYEGDSGDDMAEGHIGGEISTEQGFVGSPMFALPFGKGFGLQALPGVAWKGAGKLTSCAEDMAKWLAYLPTDPYYSALSTPLIPAFDPIRPGITILDEGEQYSLGMFNGTYKGVPYIEHWGAVSGFSGLITILPSLGISVLSLNNNSEGGELGSLIVGMVVSRILGDPMGPVFKAMTTERVERIRQETADFGPVHGLAATSSNPITGIYIGSGIGKISFTSTSNVESRPQCVTFPWMCWLHGDIKPIITCLGGGRYAGCLEYRQWGRDGDQAAQPKYGSPFRLERVAGGGERLALGVRVVSRCTVPTPSGEIPGYNS